MLKELKDQGVGGCICAWLNDKESGKISAPLSGGSSAKERRHARSQGVRWDGSRRPGIGFCCFWDICVGTMSCIAPWSLPSSRVSDVRVIADELKALSHKQY